MFLSVALVLLQLFGNAFVLAQNEATCEVPVNNPKLRIVGARDGTVTAGNKIIVQCVSGGSSKLVECLPSGQWSSPFPTCIDPRGCGPPPLLENGDNNATSCNEEFAHNTKVQYQCKHLYTMEGGPYKTCFNGEWTPKIKCLKPCTVDTNVMDTQNIKFAYSSESKLYTAHNTGLIFMCKPGKKHNGSVEMRQICLDGRIRLPTCY